MKSVIRKVAALLLALVLITGLSVPAFAVTYPTASVRSYTTSIRRGRTATFTYYLNSGSYTRYRGIYRSEIEVKVFNGSGYCVAYSELYFSGRFNHTFRWSVPSYIATGRYRVNYRTYFNKNKYSYAWYYNSRTTNRNTYLTIRR